MCNLPINMFHIMSVPQEEAAKRDHRKLGQELDLFSIQVGSKNHI